MSKNITSYATYSGALGANAAISVSEASDAPVSQTATTGADVVGKVTETVVNVQVNAGDSWLNWDSILDLVIDPKTVTLISIVLIVVKAIADLRTHIANVKRDAERKELNRLEKDLLMAKLDKLNNGDDSDVDDE